MSRILIVDDEPLVLRALARELREEGEVVTSDSSLDALRMLQAEAPAVVIADYRMPGLDGVTLLEYARAWNASTTRIMISGCADAAALEEARQNAGISRFLSKPWQRGELLDAVREGLETHRQAVEAETPSGVCAAADYDMRLDSPGESGRKMETSR